jgi:MHS family alpha-ketoglutarate permease-like MFS transporter
VIVALCLAVYITIPETGDRGYRVTVAPADPEVLEGEHLLLSTSSAKGKAKRSS